MAFQKIEIKSIFGGITPAKYFPSKGEFSASIGIDPDMPMTDSSLGISGALRPTAMAKFSASEITGVPMWFVTNPKTTTTYLYANDGKVHAIDSNIAMTTALNSGNALTTASGNGAAYYDNYAFFATNVDITAYGPLNGAAALDQVYWDTTRGKSALTNTTYPTINGISMPNHVMHRHVSTNKLFFADVVGNQGVLHYIALRKTTVEGDTDDGSTENAIDFPYGYWPTAIETYGTDLAVALVEGTSTAVKQRRAHLSFWDTSSTSFSLITDVEFPDPIISALKNINGTLYVFSGGGGIGCRVSVFLGGYTFKEIAYLQDSYPPFQGAVDHILNKIAFGGSTTYPEVTASVFSIGSITEKLGKPVHNILKATSAGTSPLVTAVKYVQNAAFAKPQPVIGWTDGSAKGLDALSTTYGVSVWRSPLNRIGKPFRITAIELNFGATMAANMTIVPKIFVDDESSSFTLTTINSTNFPSTMNNGGGRWLKIVTTDTTTTAIPSGYTDFILELRWSGSALIPIKMPITIYFTTDDV